VKPSGVKYALSAETIAEYCTWPYWSGMTAVTCGQCHAKGNVHACGPGWECPFCSAFNGQSMTHIEAPWDEPDFGPSKKTIREGIELAGRTNHEA
jgi:hypothetical protein